MPPTLRAGVILGLALAAWTLVMGLTGWFRHPSLWILAWLAVPMQIAFLLWTLRNLAPTSGYGRQLWNGVSVSLLASMIVYAASLLFTTRVFPHYFQDLEALGRQLMARQGLSPAQIEAVVRDQAPLQTPRARAMAGAIGTVATGFLTSVIAGLWLRKR
jgi:Protein of unknown function (DUF4199)